MTTDLVITASARVLWDTVPDDGPHWPSLSSLATILAVLLVLAVVVWLSVLVIRPDRGAGSPRGRKGE